MLTDDKIKAGENYSQDDNINTRDQNRSGIIFLVLFALAFASLWSLGMSHSPSNPTKTEQQDMSGTGGKPLGEKAPESFDVERSVGAVELPGTVGKPQHFLEGHGNTPTELPQGQSPGTSADTATNQQSSGKASSGPTSSDKMQPATGSTKAAAPTVTH